MISNNARIGRALYLLKIDLDAFIPRVFLVHHRDEAPAVLHQILGQPRDPQKPFQNMKTQDLLAVMQASWWDVFNRSLSGIDPMLVREVAVAHETWANRHNFTTDATFQALTSIQRLLSAMSSPSTHELEMLRVESLEAEVEIEVSEGNQIPPSAGSLLEQTETEPRGETGEAGESLPDESDIQPAGVAEPYLADLVRALRQAGALQDQDFIYQTTANGAPLEYADDSVIRELEPSLVQALADLGRNNLHAYQGQALSLSLAGTNVALQCGWGSDETLTYALPLAETLLKPLGGNALVICPSDSGARQTSARLDNLLSPSGLQIRAWVGDSSPPALELPDEGSATVLVTTPEILNRSLLADRGERQGFLGGLKYVAIDQGQNYRGNLGANIALLLRRFAHLLAMLGADPRYFLVAGGCANGPELAETLTGQSFQAVAIPAGPSSKRHYLFVDQREADLPARADLSDRVSRAALACVRSGKSVAVICSGEKMTRQCHAAALALGEAQGAGEDSFLLNQDEELHYFAPAVVNETGLTRGAIFTTVPPEGSAGLGDFDGLILAGFPGTIPLAMNLLMARRHRSEEESFVLYYPSAAPGDAFFAHNLETLLGKDPDQIVVDVDAQDVVRPHLPCLVQESDGRIFSFSRDVLGNTLFQALRRDAAELADSEDEFPQGKIDLGDGAEPRWSLWCSDEYIGRLSPYRKFREAYPGAVLNIDGEKYRLVSAVSDPETGEPARLNLETSEGLANLKTEPDFATVLAIQDESLCLSLATGVSLNLGSVMVEERLTQISAMEESAALDFGIHPGTETASEPGSGSGNETRSGLHVTYSPEEEVSWQATSPAFWIDAAGLVAGSGAHQDSSQSEESGNAGVAALERMFHLGIRFSFPIDEYDVATYVDGTRVFLVEVSPAAQGIVKKAFDRWRDILEFGANLARQCECDRGCFRCLATPSATGTPPDKAAGLALVDRLLEVTQSS